MAGIVTRSAGAPPGRRALAALLALAVLIPGRGGAQPDPAGGSMPESAVMVLELISDTHVKPTTGVVIGVRGLVMVPADFVHAGDEIVVLDGGTDIVRHGRPARTVGRSVNEGLAVLSVEGLQRRPLALSSDAPQAGAMLRFAGFPPAERIAEGAPPVHRQVRLERDAAGEGWSVAGDTALPNLTGPLFDRCGHLAGYNLARELPSLQSDTQPLTLLAADLARILEAMQVDFTREPCGAIGPSAAEAEALGREDQPAPGQPQSANEQQAGESGSATEEQAGPASEAERPRPRQAEAPPLPEPAPGEEPPPANHPAWLALALALALLGVLAWPRLRRHHLTAVTAAAAGAEPDTVPLAGAAPPPNAVQRIPGRAAAMDDEPRPEGFPVMLRLDATLPDGTRVRRYAGVGAEGTRIVIGRGTADVDIPSPAVSRRHARIRVAGDTMTICDLGSRNGTWVRNVPCLPGEVFHVEPRDEVALGDVRLQLTVESAAGPST